MGLQELPRCRRSLALAADYLTAENSSLKARNNSLWQS